MQLDGREVGGLRPAAAMHACRLDPVDQIIRLHSYVQSQVNGDFASYAKAQHRPVGIVLGLLRRPQRRINVISALREYVLYIYRPQDTVTVVLHSDPVIGKCGIDRIHNTFLGQGYMRPVVLGNSGETGHPLDSVLAYELIINIYLIGTVLIGIFVNSPEFCLAGYICLGPHFIQAGSSGVLLQTPGRRESLTDQAIGGFGPHTLFPQQIA